ncbi:MAG: 3-hydroxyacyl-CoA dehydrogenase, partial [Alphaproteobacteria bacterium]|nr:3-hydroxyacyl-CoA dehydrogenase [Alphaproteobacteria bacterium]
IEAIVENLEIKQQVFKELETLCESGTILATNTSSLSVTAIGAVLERPENFVGVHFFNPPAIMKLVEVVRGFATSPQTAETAFATVTEWGKKAVVAKSTPGFIVNRVARPFYAEALRVVEEGAADIATIDAVMREAGGFRMGPFQLMDLIGNDINLAVTKTVYDAFYFDPRYLPSLLQEDLVAAGRLGRKSGHGYYDYADDAAEPAPATAAPAPAPAKIVTHGPLGPAEPLRKLAADAGIAVEEGDSTGVPGTIVVDGVHLALSDGMTASERAQRSGSNEWVLFDLALDYEKATRIAVAPADQASDKATAAAGFFQALGKSVSVVDDIPGLIVMRTVAMLANEGADAVRLQVCDAAAVDIAMCNGVNYPLGPLAWADQVGLGHIETVLTHMARAYEDGRYRCSPLIKRKVLAGGSFF